MGELALKLVWPAVACARERSPTPLATYDRQESWPIVIRVGEQALHFSGQHRADPNGGGAGKSASGG